MSKDNMLEYDFVDKFTKSLASTMNIDTSEIIYSLELKKQEYILLTLAGIGFLGILYLSITTYWL